MVHLLKMNMENPVNSMQNLPEHPKVFLSRVERHHWQELGSKSVLRE